MQNILRTSGTNLRSTLTHEDVDAVRTITNDIVETLEVLGIEACRSALLRYGSWDKGAGQGQGRKARAGEESKGRVRAGWLVWVRPAPVATDLTHRASLITFFFGQRVAVSSSR